MGILQLFRDLQQDHSVIGVSGQHVGSLREPFYSNICEFWELYKKIPKPLDECFGTMRDSPFKVSPKESNDVPNEGIIFPLVFSLEIPIL